MELTEVFQEIKGERDIKEIIELNLENAKCADLSGLPTELPELAILNAAGLGLSNLNGLPQMPKLHTLNLSENKLTGADLSAIAEKCPNVEQLNLCDNKIATVDELKSLTTIKNLLTLDLYENEITKIPTYREDVFKLFENLRYLDGYDSNNVELEMSDDESIGEDEMDSGAEDEDDVSEEEEVGLAYLDSSKCMEDDDSADFEEKPRKRKAEASGDDGPQEKQAKDE